MKKLARGSAGIRVVLSMGEMLVYHDTTEELLFSRPIYEGEWDELFAFLRRGLDE